MSGLKLGINGLGRIGKLTLWHHVERGYFPELVVNVGRSSGMSLADIAHYIERDSTYGTLHGFLFGYRSEPVIQELDENNGVMKINGITVRFLRSHRNPLNLCWKDHEVKLVVDATGQFLDPTLNADQSGGSLRSHIEAGAEKVIVSAPFKIKDKGKNMPDDAVTTVMGINDHAYDPRRHRLISNASCTTTCLAHLMKPLVQAFGHKKILSASMATVHAATGTQAVLDRLPKAGATDLRKTRSIMNNIILTSTGAANTLRLVIPEMEHIGFIAESVRIPTATGSLIILVVTLQEDLCDGSIRRETINGIYRETAQNDLNRYLMFSEKQNVSSDIIGLPRAAAIVEGHETHTRTADVTIDLTQVPGVDKAVLGLLTESVIKIPVTQAVIYGWYDNEMGSYVQMLGDRTVTIAEQFA